MPRITRSHHVFSIEHLLGQFGYSDRAILLTTARSQRGEAGHEEMQTGERN